MAELTLGRISFINVAPVYYALEKDLIHHNFTLVYANPAQLNNLMAQGRLLLSSCSCMEYARRWQRYYLAKDLCIASAGPVMSVLLLSQKPLSELGETDDVLFTGQSHTSVALTRLLLRRRYKVPVTRFATGNVKETLAYGHRPTVVLSIGDEALRVRSQSSYPYVIDLAECWNEWTGLPFVFALWVISRKAVQDGLLWEDPTSLICQSRDYGLEQLEDILPSVVGKTPLTQEQLRFYYTRALNYHLGVQELQGLKLFFEMLVEEELLSSLPEITFFPS